MFVAYGVGGLFGVVAVARSDGKSRKTVTCAGALVLAVSLVVIGAAQSALWLLVGAFLDATGATMLVHGGEIAIANALAAAGLGHQLERVIARSNVYAVAGDAVGPLVVAATTRRRARLAAAVLRRRRARRGVRRRDQPLDVPRAGRRYR